MTGEPAGDEPEIDVMHSQRKLIAVGQEAIVQSRDLDDAIRLLISQGMGLLWICRALQPHVTDEPLVLKRRVLEIHHEVDDAKSAS